MKHITFAIILLFVFGCKNKITTDEITDIQVIRALKKNKIKTPIIALRTENNKSLKDIKNIVVFKKIEEILQISDENFYSLDINTNKSNVEIGFSNYKTGYDYFTVFDNKLKNEIIFNEKIQTKRGESKPYYIYWAIMKQKYPKLMNWNKFHIPVDSLK